MQVRVLLVSMPFVGLERPSLGLSLLQAELKRRAIPCDIRYLAFTFADVIGIDDYLWVNDELPYTAFAGDWVFAEALHGPDPDADQGYHDQILSGTWRLGGDALTRLLRVRAHCQPFLDHCLQSIDWRRYDVVGFTSTFTQNLASLAFAKQLKARYPHLLIVFGGANWEGEMGLALHERFEFVDYACCGEADDSFPTLIEALDGSADRLSRIPGVVYRAGGASRIFAPAAPVVDLDRLPYPMFDDYFRDLEQSASATGIDPVLLLETSRGCWWGAKSHCTFCGLNGHSMAFRSKSAGRVVKEIHHLQSRFGSGSFEVVDNILDMGYFRSLFPMLIEQNLDVSLFYEIKANLRREQVRMLRDAGVVTVQPGIESLSDHILGLMGKGTSALQNVQLLKWCMEYGVHPEWNLLYGFPGETNQDYVETAEMIEAIDFLTPPSGLGPVRLDRFSPYFNNPGRYGIVNVRSMAPYRFLYPFEQDTLNRIACYFDYDMDNGRDPEKFAAPVVEQVQRWQQRDAGGLWVVERLADRAIILDQRDPDRRHSYALAGWKGALYLSCDRARSRSRLQELAASRGASNDQVNAFLEWCLGQQIMISRQGRCLSLAVHTPPRIDAVQRPLEVIPVANVAMPGRPGNKVPPAVAVT